MKNLRISIIHFAILVSLSFSAHSQNASTILKNAYKKKSVEELGHFFNYWSNDIRPVSSKELSLLNDTIQQSYKAFTAFYKPHRVDSLGGSEWGDSVYTNARYLIVQNFIKIYFTDKLFYNEQEVDSLIVDYVNRNVSSDTAKQNLLKRTNGKLSQRVIELYSPNRHGFSEERGTLTDSIVNFRPIINCAGKKPLYLNSNYREILTAFLGSQHTPLGAGGIMSPARPKGQSKKRKEFLEHYVKIWYGHWGGYWQLLSYPSAYSITFDRNMKYARVDFKMIYEGGEAILENANGHWTMISARRTWIE